MTPGGIVRAELPSFLKFWAQRGAFAGKGMPGSRVRGMLAQGVDREPEVEPSPSVPFPYRILPRTW